jgi:hypothetical protein
VSAVVFESCRHSVAIEGRTYPCRLHAGHRHQHRARVAQDRTVSVGRLEHGAEIVWPNTQENT